MSRVLETESHIDVSDAPRGSVEPETAVRDQRETHVASYVWAATRLSIGFVFLWAFADKLLALGYAAGKDRETGAIDRFSDAAWIKGGSPTRGFLSGVSGPFRALFEPMAGAVWADWLFMTGLVSIGTALMLGIDDHLIYALVLIGLAAVHAGDTGGFGRRWARTDLVNRHPILL